MSVQLKSCSDLLALATGNPHRLALSWAPSHITAKRFHTPQNVIVTGANGFVGLHLIRELTSRTQISEVHAFVRANSDSTGLKRLLVAARRFGLTITNQEKLKVHSASFLHTLTSPLAEQLAEEVDSVIHAAGSTNHVRSYFYYRKESVLPLMALMQFARKHREKSLHIIGSIGADIYVQLRDFFRLSFFHCGYSRMKWVTKHMARIAYDFGLPITMYLPSYVIGSACTGYRDPGMRYSFWQMLRLCNDLNMIWDSGNETIPVVTGDDLSRKIVDNALEEGIGPCVYPSSCVRTEDVANRFKWDHVPWPVFYKTLRKRHRLLKWHSATSFQDYMTARLLFPDNLPELVHRASRAIDKASLSADTMKTTADTIYACAEQNYLFNRKQGKSYV